MGERGRRGASAAGHVAAGRRGELRPARVRAEIGDAARAAAGAPPVPDHGARTEPHVTSLRWRVRHQLDAVGRRRRSGRHRSAGHAHDLRAAGGGRGDDPARASAERVGLPRALRRRRPAARGAASSRLRSRAPGPRPDHRARPRSPASRRQGADGIVGAGGDAGRGVQGKNAARARRSGRVPDTHRLDADRAVSPHPFRRATRRRRARVDSRQCLAGRREPVHQFGNERVLLPAAEHASGPRAGPRTRDGVPRARPRDRPGRLCARAAHVEARGAHRGIVRHAARAGGVARQRGRAVAVCARGRERHRGVPEGSGKGAVRVRNVECGMRNVSGRSSPWIEPPRQFRIPHSALRILLLTMLAGAHGLLFFDNWLRLVTTHELAHVFHLDRSRGVWRGLQRVFGRTPGLFPNEYQPSWVIAGLATYYESKFTNAGRVRGSFHTQVLGADRAAATARSPWNATLFTRWADGLVPYAYGSRFLHYLAGAAGDSVVPRFAEATSGQLIPFRVGRQVARVAPGRTLAREWSRGTAPDLAVASAAPPDPRVLDSLLRTEPVPRVSPDGRRAAYVRDDGKGTSVLRVLDATTGRSLAARRVNGGVDYDWQGDTLVVTQLDFTSRWRLRSDLYRWVPGRAWRRATRGARLVAPAAGGGRVAAIPLGPPSARPTVPAPGLPPG